MDTTTFNALKGALADINDLEKDLEAIHVGVDNNLKPDEIRALTLKAFDSQIKTLEGLRDIPGSRADESLPFVLEARAAFLRKDDIALVYWNAKANMVGLATMKEMLTTVLACEEAHPS